MQKYDITIYGATGFTGKHVILEVVKTLENAAQDERFSWAIAGRSEKKLNAVLNEISKESGKDLKDVVKIIADSSDFASLRKMAQMSRVVLNCAGPYILFGEEVVKACVEEGSHHLDLSGEPQFLEKMQLLYSKRAEETGAYIVGACGFDSIPSDYGTMYMEKHFEGELNSVDSIIKVDRSKTTPKINFGTWHSGVLMCHDFFEVMRIGQKLYSEPYYKFQYKVPYKPMCYNDVVDGWCVNLPFPDARVMKRTQQYKYYVAQRKPIQTQAWVKVPNFFLGLLMCIGMVFLGFIAQFKCGVRLLENYPGVFSFGRITKKGPTKAEMDADFTFTLVGKGWKKISSASSDKHETPPNKTSVLQVKGNNPGYGATCTLMLQAGVTVLKETDKLPKKGGVYTPGIMFEKTNLAERCTRHGVSFTILK